MSAKLNFLLVLSILIVNWNTRDKLDACLSSIRAFPPHVQHEVIVVDNASTDGSGVMLREKHPWVRAILSQGNTGYAAGNNIACAAASGAFLLTLNPDTEFRDDSLQKALDFLSAHPRAGAVGIKQILPNGAVQRSIRGFPTFLGLTGSGTGLDRLFPNSPFGSYSLPSFDHEVTQQAPQPMGTFILFRREALEGAGNPRSPFDPIFPIFFNEVDLLLRVKKAGWEIWHCAEASCLHHHGSSTRQVKPKMVWESHYSLVRYLKKNAEGLDRLFLPLASVLSYVTALVRARGIHGGFQPDHHHLQLEHPE